jgi:hypothetical protein
MINSMNKTKYSADSFTDYAFRDLQEMKTTQVGLADMATDATLSIDASRYKTQSFGRQPL